MKNLMTRLFREEEGQGMVEYGILIAVLAVAIVAGAWAMRSKLEEIVGMIEDLKFTEPA